MNKSTVLKLVLVACIAVIGFATPQPAPAYLHLCSWEYCDGNWNCNCRCCPDCLGGVNCAEALEMGCFDEY